MDDSPANKQRRSLNKLTLWHTFSLTQQWVGWSVCHTLYVAVRRCRLAYLCLLLLVSLSVMGCGGNKTEMVKVPIPLDSLYAIKTEDVNMVVSDSGVLQYRLKAKEWLIYNNNNKKQWVFNRGFYLENFDTLLNVKAMVTADTAIQYLDKDLWELIGHVRIKDLQGRHVFSPHLFWDKANRKIYSHDSIYIETPTRVIRGSSFYGKDDLSEYTSYDNSGSFEVPEEEGGDMMGGGPAMVGPSDSLVMAPRTDSTSRKPSANRRMPQPPSPPQDTMVMKKDSSIR